MAGPHERDQGPPPRVYERDPGVEVAPLGYWSRDDAGRIVRCTTVGRARQREAIRWQHEVMRAWMLTLTVATFDAYRRQRQEVAP